MLDTCLWWIIVTERSTFLKWTTIFDELVLCEYSELEFFPWCFEKFATSTFFYVFLGGFADSAIYQILGWTATRSSIHKILQVADPVTSNTYASHQERNNVCENVLSMCEHYRNDSFEFPNCSERFGWIWPRVSGLLCFRTRRWILLVILDSPLTWLLLKVHTFLKLFRIPRK